MCIYVYIFSVIGCLCCPSLHYFEFKAVVAVKCFVQVLLSRLAAHGALGGGAGLF